MADHHDHATDCEEALAELYTFLDGELTDARRALIASHLENCNPCIEAYDFEAELRMVISTRCRSDEVPQTLRLRIAQKITLIANDHDVADSDLDRGDGGARSVGA